MVRQVVAVGIDELGGHLPAERLDLDQLAAWYDWLPWREWRLGPQRYASDLIARELSEIAEKAARS